MTTKEKAERYDALRTAIEFYYKQFSVYRSYANAESMSVGAVGMMLLVAKARKWDELQGKSKGMAADSIFDEGEDICS